MGSTAGFAKKFICTAIAVLILIAAYAMPCPEGLSQGGKMSIALLLFIFVMWVGEAVPKSLSGILAIFMLPYFGAADSLSQVFTSFVNSIFFFLLAVYGIAAVINKSDIPSRLMSLFVRWFGNNSKMLILAFSATAFVVSAFMSDLAAAALLAGIAFTLVNTVEFPKRFVKCLMMSIPFGAMAGGVIMPISSATNATIMQLLVQTTGSSVNFLQWMIVGIPVGLAGLLLGWLFLVVILRPEPLDETCMEALHNQFETLGTMSIYDKKAMAVVGLMLACWICGSWFPVLDSNVVAFAGLFIMFLPKIELLDWKYYEREVPWDLILMLCSMFALSAAMIRTGAIDWIVTTTLGDGGSMDPTFFFVLMSVVLVVIRAFIPAGAPVVVMITPSLLAMGNVVGIDPILLLITLSAWCQMTYLLPIIDALWNMTYQWRHFTQVDALKVGIPLTLALIVVFTLLIPPLATASYIVA